MKVLIGVPTYDGNVNFNCVSALTKATQTVKFDRMFVKHSVLTKTFNMLWAHALNERANGLTHFAMLHADIAPEDWWLDKMLRIMMKHGADVLSAVVPIKSHQGLTSTALETDDEWACRRLTLREVYAMAPTFTDDGLLVNTGLMLVDMRKPWVEQVCFRFEDDVIKRNGKWEAVSVSEDWCFSLMAKKYHARLFATREVALTHTGSATYPNTSAWGTAETDLS